ncbi:hypothetical protein O5542_30050, partial [Escherichia coli]|nr:hypothetical protein [Escherichia coli]
IMGNGSVTLTTTVADQPDGGFFFCNQKTLPPIRLTTSYTVTTGLGLIERSRLCAKRAINGMHRAGTKLDENFPA